MPWGAALAAGGALLGGALSSNATGDAANQQQAGVQSGIESEERMFERSLALQAPYREAGYDALGGLQDLTSPQGRSDSLQQYYQGPEFGAMSAQVEEQQMRNAAVTGGVRGGANQAALATIAPQLGQQYLAGQNQRYTGLANLGAGAASQGSSQATMLGGNISNLQQQAAQAGAQNSLAQANIWGNTASTLGALGYDYFNRPQQG